MLNNPFKNLVFSIILIFCFGIGQAQETERVRVYRVQFAASKSFIEPSYFQKKFNLEDSIKYFEKDDYYKYYVGDFDTEAEATSYFHKTGDVGYITSIMIDRQIVVEQDTSKQQKDPNNKVLNTSDTVYPDSSGQPSEINTQEEPFYQDINNKLTNFQKLLIGLGFFLIVLVLVMIIWSRIRTRRKAEHEMDDLEFLEYDDEELFKKVPKKELKEEPVEEEPIEEHVNDEGSMEEDELLVLDTTGKELSNSFDILNDPENDLSGWDQLRMLEMTKDSNIEPPDFSLWLGSKNFTIVAFCLRMIRSLKQENAYKAVSKLLNHEKDDIRSEAIVTLGVLGNKGALGLFREKFDQETYTNKMLILRSMARLPDDSSIDFLKDLLKVYGNLQIEAANALASIESVGIEGVEKILEENAISSETIARHILINKL